MKKETYTIVILVLLFLTVAWEAFAVPQFRNIPMEQAESIYSIDQDGDGLIWLGTTQGIYCFDGYRFVPHRETGIDNIVYAVCCYQELVIIGGQQGLVVYDRNEGKPVKLNRQLKLEVRSLVRMGDQVYVGTSNGLYRLDPQKKQVSLVCKLSHQILALSPTDRGILIGTMAGLYEYTEGKCLQVSAFGTKHQLVVSAIAYDKQTGKYWIGSFEHLYQYDLHTGVIQMQSQCGRLVVKALETTPLGLLICADDGLYILKDGQVEHLVHDSRHPTSLGNNVVWDAYCDPVGNVYLGSDLCLSVITRTGWAFYRPLDMLTGLSMGNVLTNMLSDSQGVLWMGGTGGLIRMSSPVCWFLQNSAEYPISHNRVRALCEDQEHRLWISTDIGLNFYDSQQNRMQYRMLKDNQTGKELPWIYDILDDGTGKLWFATCDDGVYATFRKKILQAEYECRTEKHIRGLASQKVKQLAMADQHHVWVRTSRGIDLINKRTYHVSHLRADDADLMCADRKGRMWVADRKKITIYTASGRQVCQMPFALDQLNDKVVAMLDIDGNMWVITSTCCAIYRDSKWLTSVRIPDIKVHSACYMPMSKSIILGGEDVTVTLDPRQILRNSQQQSLILTNLMVNGKQYQPESSSLMTMKKLTLSHEQNNLMVSLTDLPLGRMANAVYAYRMNGMEDEWHYLNRADEQIIYNSLPYGAYALEVRSVDGFRPIGKVVYRLAIDILPPWYLTWWAKLLYTFAVLAIACAGIKLYLIRQDLRKEKQARQQVMDESSARIRFYNALYENLYHGLSRIMSRLTSMSDRQTSEDQQVDYRLLSFESTRLNAYIHQALDLGTPSADERLEQQQINIVRFCDTIVRGLAGEAGRKHIKLNHVSANQVIHYCVNVIQWDTVFYTFLKSAIDYSCDGATVVLDIHETEDKKSLAITLNSSKFAVLEKDLPFFFQRYYNLLSETKERVQNMYLIKEFCEQYRGSIDIQTSEKDHVIMNLILPLDSRYNQDTSSDMERSMLYVQDEKLLKEITAVIETNISNSDFNVTQLQKEVGIGSKLLYRKVKAFTGMSPVEYIRDIRMKQASRLLTEGRFAISEVMYMVGFSNSGYFSKCFQKAFGVTPTQYIQQHRN